MGDNLLCCVRSYCTMLYRTVEWCCSLWDGTVLFAVRVNYFSDLQCA